MSKRIHWKYWFGIALFCMAIALLIIYTSNQPITSWDSPRLLKIEKEWSKIWNNYYEKTPQDKSKYEEAVEMSNGILKKHLSTSDLRRLAATCESIPVRSIERTEFQDAVLDYMTKTFANTGDRDSLVKLLSTRLLDPLYYVNIEFFLAHRGDNLVLVQREMETLIGGLGSLRC